MLASGIHEIKIAYAGGEYDPWHAIVPACTEDTEHRRKALATGCKPADNETVWARGPSPGQALRGLMVAHSGKRLVLSPGDGKIERKITAPIVIQVPTFCAVEGIPEDE